MVTFGCGKREREKERRKSILIAKNNLNKIYYDELNSTGIEKLEYELGRAESTLYNALNDLNNPTLKGNILIIQKAEYARQRIEYLKNKIKEEKEKLSNKNGE